MSNLWIEEKRVGRKNLFIVKEKGIFRDKICKQGYCDMPAVFDSKEYAERYIQGQAEAKIRFG